MPKTTIDALCTEISNIDGILAFGPLSDGRWYSTGKQQQYEAMRKRLAAELEQALRETEDAE